MAEKLYMIALSPTMEQGKITEWHKKEGDSVKNGDVLCEVETDKAVMEYEADFDAVLLKILASEGQSASVGDVIAVYGEKGETYSGIAAAESKNIESIRSNDVGKIREYEFSTETNHERIKSSPLARKIAKSLKIDLDTVQGSGFNGRIIKRDIERVMESTQSTDFADRGKSTNTVDSGSELISVSSMRNTIAKRLSASKFSAPHFYLTVQADMSYIISAREEHEKRTGGKISFNSYLIKLSAAALKKHPVVNSAWENDKIRKFLSADIGFAVALEEGLIAPVIRNCGAKGISEIDREFKILADKARNGSIVSAEYSGAGFSISNLGSLGIEEFTAIINPPGSAILALGAIIKKPVVVTDDEGTDAVVVKPVMKMTLSCDHRVIDGAAGAAFLADLKRMIENPVEALM